MLREVDLDQISDGKLYQKNDLVKCDCHDCIGCSDCCRGMEDTIVLDAYDMWQFEKGTSFTFAQMLEKGYLELGVVDGIVLPHIKMQEKTGACAFLSDEGRCSIHDYRTGICRLFPLGRIYDEAGDFSYFLQTNECKNPSKTKVKVKKWMGIPAFERYEGFVKEWHALLKKAREVSLSESDFEKQKNTTMLILRTFFLTPYETDDFYDAFEERKERIQGLL